MADTVQALALAPLVARVESLREGLDELKALLVTHYDELSEHKARGYELVPQYREYLLREDCGQVLYVTLRDEGRLVGYFVGFVTRCLHYQALTLSSDIFYVMPTSRGLQGGGALLDEIEREARRRGIDPMRLGFKAAHAKHMKALLATRGYGPFEETWIKWLIEPPQGEEASDAS